MPPAKTTPDDTKRAGRTIITLPESYGPKLDKLGKGVADKLRELRLPGTAPSRSAMVQQMVDDAVAAMDAAAAETTSEDQS